MNLFSRGGLPGRFYLFATVAFFWLFDACTQSPNESSATMSSTSDNMHLVESDMSDAELTKSGLTVVYRFQTIPNVIAVKSGTSNSRPANRLSAETQKLITQNQRSETINNITPSGAVINPPWGCTTSYCEARFDQALTYLQGQAENLSFLPKIEAALLDTGVVPTATQPIEAIYASGENIDGSPQDTWAEHATNIASLVGGVVNNNTLVTKSYAPNIRLGSYRLTFSVDGEPDKRSHPTYGSMQLAVAIDMALAAGAKIINMSLSYSEAPDLRVQEAEQLVMSSKIAREAFFTTSAGNNNQDISVYNSFPASYRLRNLVVVCSHASDLKKAQSSNFGPTVDICAQAANVQVNQKDGTLTNVGGTSFAAPLVAAAAALYWAKYPTASVDTLITDLFLNAGSYPKDLAGAPVVKYGRLDVDAFIKRSRGVATP